MEQEQPHGDLPATARPQRADHGHIGPSRDDDAFPDPCRGITAASADCAIEKPLDDPGLPEHGSPAIAIAPPVIGKEIEDGAGRDGANAKWIIPALAALRAVLPIMLISA